MPNARSRTELQYFRVEPETEVCINCKYFYLHYVRDEIKQTNYFSPIHKGHCCYPRLKERKVTDNCENFSSRYELRKKILMVSEQKEKPLTDWHRKSGKT